MDNSGVILLCTGTDMKTFQVKAGEPVKIISVFSNSIPTTYHFSAKKLSEDEPLSGTITVKGSNWIFPKPPVIMPLETENTVSKSMWSTFFGVYVNPDQDVEITVKSGKMNGLLVIVPLALGVVVLAASLMIIGSK